MVSIQVLNEELVTLVFHTTLHQGQHHVLNDELVTLVFHTILHKGQHHVLNDELLTLVFHTTLHQGQHTGSKRVSDLGLSHHSPSRSAYRF